MLGRMLWPILLVGVVILGIVVTAAGAETRAQIEYLDRIEESAADIADGGVALRGVTTRLGTISRDEFVTAIELVLDDIADAVELAEEEPPTTATVPVRALYRQAMTAWRDGLEGFSDAILRAADNPGDAAAVDRVVEGLALLRVGDAVWARLLGEMEQDDLPSPLTPLPEIVMSPASGPLVSVASIYVEAARAETNTLGLRPGLRVSQVVADPPWQLDTSDEAVVPVTDGITFSVVMSNVGNVDSVAQQVVLLLEGGAEPVQMSATVEPLAPGQQVTLVFDPMTVTPGRAYVVTASIVVEAPDADLDDNLVSVQFRVGDD